MLQLYRNTASALILVALLAVAGRSAFAAAYPGSLAVFTSGATNTESLFTFTGSTLTVHGDPTGANTYFLNGTQLIGIRTIYLVNPDGSVPTGITSIPGGGFVAPTSSSASHTAWNSFTAPHPSSPYKGYDDGAPGKGYPDGSNWLVVDNPTLAGKSSSADNAFGSFTFSGSLADGHGHSLYDIGIDYLIAGGASGRAYFDPGVTRTSGGGGDPVPEPGPALTLGVFVTFLGLLIGSRRTVRLVAS
jgi:hypothetical protein